MSTLKKSSRHKASSELSEQELLSSISWQQIQLLFWDVQNLSSLYDLGVKKYSLSAEKASRLLLRVDTCMERLDDWGGQVVLSGDELNRFAECRKTLEQLGCDLSDYLK